MNRVSEALTAGADEYVMKPFTEDVYKFRKIKLGRIGPEKVMNKIKVLIVDDSVVIRSLLIRMFSEDSLIDVVGYAANGKIALAKS